MQTGQKRKTWDSSRFRGEHMTVWPRGHPVMFPHAQTDHWSKMKTMVASYLATVPAALINDTVKESNEAAPNYTNSGCSLLPPLIKDAAVCIDVVPAHSISDHRPEFQPQNMPQYRNVFSERARRGFCYWLAEKKKPACKAYSLGAYKTSLGLPKM
ncbi:uncharacterized protein LOC114855585 isoform X2 [Betta splendens]|uniref:Uncharacterized protein LOC114855585 isoform X2 n=1 Tax=Betta splendens TaxID=158456 RepID=A0A9W2XT30_BETSP|nr:uncharacterized protein LOC114855585 isoform X2 [Betta splendens]